VVSCEARCSASFFFGSGYDRKARASATFLENEPCSRLRSEKAERTRAVAHMDAKDAEGSAFERRLDVDTSGSTVEPQAAELLRNSELLAVFVRVLCVCALTNIRLASLSSK
jgi:hypothetical protein